MKVIVSHDVDHLHPSEHFLKDLFFPKLWVRSFLQLLNGKITFKIFVNRMLLVFNKRLNRIEELCRFDKEKGVMATYFFGMDNVLGMSYGQKAALPYIRYVVKEGFDVGVHGCNYDDPKAIEKEHDDFKLLTAYGRFGVRNHYVRYNEHTFLYMNKAGYLFDTSEFNKERMEYKAPYKVGDMWEFPLAIMDVYVIHNNLKDAKKNVARFVDDVIKGGGQYLTILLHDTYFNAHAYPVEKAFYEWLIGYLIEKDLEFISYKDAIEELENEGKH